MADHLGCEAHALEGRRSRDSCNGCYPQTVRIEIGEVCAAVPRNRYGDPEPVTVPVGQRRPMGSDPMVISLYANGLTTGDVTSHPFDVYDRHLDNSTTARVIEGIRIKIRDRTVTNRCVYAVMGINMDGERDIPGLWVGPSGVPLPFRHALACRLLPVDDCTAAGCRRCVYRWRSP